MACRIVQVEVDGRKVTAIVKMQNPPRKKCRFCATRDVKTLCDWPVVNLKSIFMSDLQVGDRWHFSRDANLKNPRITESIDLSQKSDWGKGLATTQISFRESPTGNFQDWHPAPRRQFVIILSGQLEIGLGDGSKHVFGPGDARLVEDTTGKGHTTRVLGTQVCVTATVPLG